MTEATEKRLVGLSFWRVRASRRELLAIFRAVLDPREHETLPVARRVILAFLTPLVLAPAFALAWRNSGPATATLHVLYLLALGLCLAELQLAGYRKIPTD